MVPVPIIVSTGSPGTNTDVWHKIKIRSQTCQWLCYAILSHAHAIPACLVGTNELSITMYTDQSRTPLRKKSVPLRKLASSMDSSQSIFYRNIEWILVTLEACVHIPWAYQANRRLQISRCCRGLHSTECLLQWWDHLQANLSPTQGENCYFCWQSRHRGKRCSPCYSSLWTVYPLVQWCQTLLHSCTPQERHTLDQ